jgi:hypothetical protein
VAVVQLHHMAGERCGAAPAIASPTEALAKGTRVLLASMYKGIAINLEGYRN